MNKSKSVELKFKTYGDLIDLDETSKRLYRDAYYYLYGNQIKVDYTEFSECKTMFAYYENKAIGLITYTKPNYQGNVILEMVFTRPTYRKKGVMRKMFKHLLQYRDHISWTAVADAFPAYEAIGGLRKKHTSLFTLNREDFVDFRKD